MVPLLIQPQVRDLTLHFHFLIKHFYKLLRFQINSFLFFFFFIITRAQSPPLPFTAIVINNTALKLAIDLNLGVYAREPRTAVEFQVENGGVVE